MKSIILSILILICCYAFSEIIIPQNMPQCSINVYSTDLYFPHYIFNYRDYVLIVSNNLNVSPFSKLIRLCGYECVNLIIENNDTLSIKQQINNTLEQYGFPICIFLIGNEDIIASFHYNNPYTKTSFPGDNYYGKINNNYIEDIPISRIPVRNNYDIIYLYNNTLKYLMYNNDICYAPLSPFYDNNTDNKEDYAYCLINYNTTNSIENIIYLFETDYKYPLYFYDGSNIPDILLYPNYDWELSYTDINKANNSLCIMTYWGHGNQFETVFPNISIAYFDSLNFDYPGGFIGFSCLLGAFDKNLTNRDYCFADSLLFTKNNCFSICASSETFYNYNKLMLIYLYDIIKNDSSNNMFICNILRQIKEKLLLNCSLNDYLLSQINSYNLFAFPLLTIRKTKSDISFICNDTIELSEPFLYIQCNEQNLFYISNNEKITDTFNVYNTRLCTLNNLKENSYYYISIYKNGILNYDSFYIKSNTITLNNITINDICGDNDSIAETGELLYIVYSVDTDNDSIIVKLNSNDLIIKDSIHTYKRDFLKDSFLVKINTTDNANIIFNINNEYYYHTIKVEKRALSFVCFDNINSDLMFVNNKYNLYFKFKMEEHHFNTANFIFINNEFISFDYNNIHYNELSDTILVWNNVYFHKDSGIIQIIVDYDFNKDTFTINYNLTKPHSIYFYDPSHIYENTLLLRFIKDSLNLLLKYSDKEDSVFYYNTYMLCYGYYPYLFNPDTLSINFIKNIINKNIPIYIEGSRIVKNYFNDSLRKAFNIKDCSSIFLPDSTNIYFPIIQDSIMVKENIFSADIYKTDYTYLYKDTNFFSSYNSINIIQSIPLNCIYYNDINFLYYLYICTLLNFSSSIEYNNNILINKQNTITIKNISNNPLLIKFIYIPNFIESINSNKRIILSDSSISFKIKLKSQLNQNYTDKIIFTDGIDIYEINVKYIYYSMDFSKKILIDDNSIIIPLCADSIIIPHKYKHYYNIEKYNNFTKIKGDIYLLNGHTIIIFKNNIKKHILINVKGEHSIYNILGAKIFNIKSNGVYFSNKKIVHIK